MYQGKFDKKNKKTDVTAQELLSQRNAAPEQKKRVSAPAAVPAEEPAPVKKQKKAAPQSEVTEVPEKKAAKKAAPQSEVAEVPEKKTQKKGKKKKKGSRKGGVIFYTFYFMLILLFAGASFLGLKWLENWLTAYEAAQPTVKCQEVFDQLFADPDWGTLYEMAGVEDSLFEGKDAYVAHMQSKVGDRDLTYLETSAGLSQDKKYVVQLDGENIATFTLVGEQEFITDIPDWTLGKVDLLLQRNNTVRIQKLDAHTVHVNGVALDDSYTIQIASTSAEDYLPIGLTGVRMCTQEVTGLMTDPVITVTDEEGNQKEVSYDEGLGCYVELTESNTISDAHRELALETVKTYCKWMIEEVNSRATIAKYFDPSADPYKNIISMQNDRWMQDHNGYKFTNETVSGYAMYGDSIFSVRVSLSLNVTRTDGTVKEYSFDQALFFNLKDTGNWLCYEMTNEDVSMPRGEVRLTFMDGEDLLTTGFYDTDASNLIAPVLSAPEGKVFSGWVRKDVDANGRTTLTLMFQPDAEGKVSIPEGTTLTPMVLYAYYQDAASVPAETAAPTQTEAPAETTAAEETTAPTQTETVPETTAAETEAADETDPT